MWSTTSVWKLPIFVILHLHHAECMKNNSHSMWVIKTQAVSGSARGQAGWGSEQTGLVEGVPACGRGVEQWWSQISLPTQTILRDCACEGCVALPRAAQLPFLGRKQEEAANMNVVSSLSSSQCMAWNPRLLATRFLLSQACCRVFPLWLKE